MVRIAEPKLKIIGVYRPEISAETWQEQWNITADDSETHKHFDRLVLIEAIADGLEDPFGMAELGQMHADYGNVANNMQVGYDEALLSSDGEVIIERAMNCVKGTGPLRFAVYLHLYDAELPLLWQGGEVTCPRISSIPVRLLLLMPCRVI